ncbi:MAG: cysteine synthase A [Alphaproteobacteria bacterium]|nr:cysteine synthase A [Alphaproteobacteria bacterium]
MVKIFQSVTEMVGNTPLVQLNNLAKKHKVKANILGKCEFFNPAFSVKDRVALNMLEKVPFTKITPDTVFVEATSGNTGVGLAAMCAAKGYKLVIIMPENMSVERIKLMRHYGAEVILTPKEDGMKGAVKKAQMLSEKNKNVIMLKQFENPANPQVHTLSTAVELIEQTGTNIDVLVCGVGTSGTITGITKALKTCLPDLYVVAVEPKESQVLKGQEACAHKIAGIGANFVPPFFEANLVDEILPIASDDAINMAKEVAQTEGLGIGISAGAAVKAALEIAKRPQMMKKNIVVILPDAIERYLSLSYFDVK